MRKLHIQSDNEKDFLENLRELMVSRGIFKLKVRAEKVSRKLFDYAEVFDSKYVIIQKFVDFEDIHGFYLVGEKRNIFLIFEEKAEAFVETENVFRYVDLTRFLKLYRDGKEVLNFVEV